MPAVRGCAGTTARPGIALCLIALGVCSVVVRGRDGMPEASRIVAGAPVTQVAAAAGGGPLTPEESLASFELEPGYQIELAASEPLIRDPVAIAFDERGRMYVVENRGYPDPLDGSVAPAQEGVIALLEDANGDGRFDKRTDFATDLTYPNGVLPWNGGVFVTCAPDLLFLKDTDGDGAADERRVVLTGFDTTKTAQIRFSHPAFGLDGWVYLTGGLNGGRVTSPAHPDRPPVVFTNSDSRFDPRTFTFETTGGQGQFGQTFDDHGRRFVCSNRHPVRHVVVEPRHLQRNPHLAFSDTMQDVSTVGPQALVWPLSADMTTASFMPTLMGTPHAGTFTAASGVHIHRGDALPEGHEGSIFICESAQNLVQRQVRSAHGVTFTSAPASPGREFLASRDNWFRPVFAANGPDGALYVVDMYRKVIDHPQYVPESSRTLLDFQAGKERGRIYRLRGRASKPERKPTDLQASSAAALTQLLEHANAWWRETAQRLLLERHERDAIPHLRALASRGRTVVGRIHALWTLESLGGLEAAHLVTAFTDGEAPVRENAVRLAEGRVSSSRDVLEGVVRLADDPDVRVRFHAALTLGAANGSQAIDALALIARRDGANRWVRAAVFSSIAGQTNEFFRAFTKSRTSPEAHAPVMQDLGQLYGAAETAERCLDLVLEITAPGTEGEWQAAALAGLARGLQSRGLSRDGRSALMTLLASDLPQTHLAKPRVDAVLSRAMQAARNETAPPEGRLTAIGLLGQTAYGFAGTTLLGLVEPQHRSDIQLAAVRALAQLPEPSGAAALVERMRWQAFTPQIREAVLSALMTEERHMLVLLDALDSGAVEVAALSPSRRNRLINHANSGIQARARARLGTLTSGSRMQVYERLRPAVVARPGSATSGRPLFEARCATCHSVQGTGGRLGPDLSGLRNQPADAILLHALVPDYEITPGYEAYVVVTRDGRTLVGRLQSETANSLTLTDAAAQQHVILRREVLSMSASASSLMPNELERGMSEQDLSDLIAYLKSSARAPATSDGR